MSDDDEVTTKAGMSKYDVDTSDEALYKTPDPAVRKLNFPTLSKSSSLSISKARESDIFKNCLRLLSSLLPDEMTSISDCLLDLFLKHRIYNDDGFCLFNSNDTPDESTHELWGTSTFRTGFKMIVEVAKRMDIYSHPSLKLESISLANTLAHLGNLLNQ